MEGQYNLKSIEIKRLMQETKELNEPTEQYFAQPLEDDLFEWHFTIRGPAESEFVDGLYHGRIILSPEYPMKPPSIIFLTPNGRFEINKKICLSISGHDPESWEPSWSIRTVLLAIIGFMATHSSGTIHAFDYTKDEIHSLSIRSQNWKCNICNVPNKTLLLEPTEEGMTNIQEAKEFAAQITFKEEVENSVVLQPQTLSPLPSSSVFSNFNTPDIVTSHFNASASQGEDVASDTNSASSETISKNSSPVLTPSTTADTQVNNLQTSHEIRQRITRNAGLNDLETRSIAMPINQSFVNNNYFMIIMMISSLALVSLIVRIITTFNPWKIE